MVLLTGPFTLFVPTKEALSVLDTSLPDAPAKNMADLKELLKYHIVLSALPLSSLKNDVISPTLAGGKLRINRYGSGDQSVTKNSIPFRQF